MQYHSTVSRMVVLSVTILFSSANCQQHATVKLDQIFEQLASDIGKIVPTPSEEQVIRDHQDRFFPSTTHRQDHASHVQPNKPRPNFETKMSRAAATPRQPNFIIILTDDLDALVMPIWEDPALQGNEVPPLSKTKQLLKDTGLYFSSYFVTGPTCCPGRSGLLTGRYNHNNQVMNNDLSEGGWWQFFQSGSEQDTVAVWLERAGYRTAYFGKYLNGIALDKDHIPPGWREWSVAVDWFYHYFGYFYLLNNRDATGNTYQERYGLTQEDYFTDVLKERAVQFLETHHRSTPTTPFFMIVAPTAPHLPLSPPARYADHPYKDAGLPHMDRPNFAEDTADKPPFMERLKDALNISALENDYQRRMGSLYAVDDMVAEIVATLETLGMLDNTYIFFTSDNGYLLGAHNFQGKILPYDESLIVPLIIWGPHIKNGIAIPSGTRNQIVLNIDIAPTIMALANLAIPDNVDGQSMVPIIQDDSQTLRCDFLAEFNHQKGVTVSSLIPSYRALRNKQYLYVEWLDEAMTPTDYELYDLVNDPYQVDNLLGGKNAAAYHLDRVRLKNRLHELVDCQASTCR